jgi:hypothetical protein
MITVKIETVQSVFELTSTVQGVQERKFFE